MIRHHGNKIIMVTYVYVRYAIIFERYKLCKNLKNKIAKSFLSCHPQNIKPLKSTTHMVVTYIHTTVIAYIIECVTYSKNSPTIQAAAYTGP